MKIFPKKRKSKILVFFKNNIKSPNCNDPKSKVLERRAPEKFEQANSQNKSSKFFVTNFSKM
jgi:hypothetical protein